MQHSENMTNQVLWLVWIIIIQVLGLLPMNNTLWFVYKKNYLKWNKQKREVGGAYRSSNQLDCSTIVKTLLSKTGIPLSVCCKID